MIFLYCRQGAALIEKIGSNIFADMIIAHEELEALESFFSSVELSKEMKLNKATTLRNVRDFVDQVLENLKRPDISETTLRPRYDDLITIRRELEKPDKENAA